MSGAASRIIEAVLPRLGEPSTICGVLTLCGMLTGWAVSPDNMAAIATVGSTIASIALMIVREVDGNGGSGDRPQ